MIYIASPYSGTGEEQRLRYSQVQAFCHHLFYKRKLFVYSPIVHWHPIAEKWDEYGNFETFQHNDYHMLDLAKELYVLCLDGWKESTGVQAEIRFAEGQRMNVQCFDKADFNFQASFEHARRNW